MRSGRPDLLVTTFTKGATLRRATSPPKRGLSYVKMWERDLDNYQTNPLSIAAIPDRNSTKRSHFGEGISKRNYKNKAKFFSKSGFSAPRPLPKQLKKTGCKEIIF
jgi:hypothetical protein